MVKHAFIVVTAAVFGFPFLLWVVGQYMRWMFGV